MTASEDRLFWLMKFQEQSPMHIHEQLLVGQVAIAVVNLSTPNPSKLTKLMVKEFGCDS